MVNQQTTTNQILKIRKLAVGDILEGQVFSKKRGEIFIDLSPFGVGRVYGIFYLQSKDIAQKLKIGDIVGVKVVGLDDGQGNYEVVLQDISTIDKWQKILNYYRQGKIFEAEIKAANSGGWIVEIEGVQGFVPVSQFSPEYYPRIENSNNKNLIYEHIKKFVGQKIKCKIISADPKTNKLVLSEKAAKADVYQKILDQLIIGDLMNVKVVGLSPFGIFVRFNENPPMDGLIHLSEIPDEKLNLEENFKIGDILTAKLIQIKQDRVSFSLKDTTPDPWVVFVKNYKEKDKVKGILKEKNEIFGVVEIDGVNGVILEDLDKVEINNTYQFIIENLKPKDRSLILKLANDS